MTRETIAALLLSLVLVCFSGCAWQQKEPPRTFELEVWDYRQPLVGQEFSYHEQLLHVLEQFTLEYPHITIRVRMLTWHEDLDELERAWHEQAPPDVFRSLKAASLTHHARWHGMQAQEAEAYWPAATSAISRYDICWGWPAWLEWELWLVNAAWLDDVAESLWGRWQHHGYSWDELGLILAGKPASIDWSTSRIWQLYHHPTALYVDRMTELAACLQDWRDRGAIVPVKTAQEQRLDDFYRGETPLTAPVTPYLFRYLIARISRRSEPVGRAPSSAELVWLGPPSLGVAAEFPWQVSSYHVFKVEEDDERLWWASRLAAHLAEHMGRWGAENLGVIPALKEDLARWSLVSELPLPLRSAMIRDLERETIPLRCQDTRHQEENVWSEKVLPGMLSMLGDSPLATDKLKESLGQYQEIMEADGSEHFQDEMR